MGVRIEGEFEWQIQRVMIIALGLYIGWTLGAALGELLLGKWTVWIRQGDAEWIGTLVIWVVTFETAERMPLLDEVWEKLKKQIKGLRRAWKDAAEIRAWEKKTGMTCEEWKIQSLQRNENLLDEIERKRQEKEKQEISEKVFAGLRQNMKEKFEETAQEQEEKQSQKGSVIMGRALKERAKTEWLERGVDRQWQKIIEEAKEKNEAEHSKKSARRNKQKFIDQLMTISKGKRSPD